MTPKATIPSGQEESAGSRVLFLDGLRGIAAVIVVVFHAILGYANLEDPELHGLWYGPLSFLAEGESAVLLFFVLSGIALTWGEFRGRGPLFPDTRGMLYWYLARGLRIYLPYLAALALMALSRELFWIRPTIVPAWSAWFEVHGGVEVNIHNVFHDLNLFSEHPRILAQGWSLTEEMRFAFVLPLLLTLASRNSVATLVCLGAAVSCGVLSPFLLYFTAGILISKHWEELGRYLGRLPRWAPPLLLILAIALFSIRRWMPFHFREGAQAIHSVVAAEYFVVAGAVLILVLPLGSTGFRRFLESRPVQWIGRISFSLYLVHLAVLFHGSPRLVAWLNGMGLGDTPALLCVVVAAVLVGSCLCAALFHRMVEAPCTALSRRVLAWGGLRGETVPMSCPWPRRGSDSRNGPLAVVSRPTSSLRSY